MRLPTAPLFAALLAAASVRSQAADANCTSVAPMAIPACSLQCFIPGVAMIGCGGFDTACLCRQKAALLAAVVPCMATLCSPSELQDALDGAEAVCACANQDSQAAVSGSSAPSASVLPSVGPTSTPPPATTASGPTHSATPSVILGGAPRSRADIGLVVGAFFAFVLL